MSFWKSLSHAILGVHESGLGGYALQNMSCEWLMNSPEHTTMCVCFGTVPFVFRTRFNVVPFSSARHAHGELSDIAKPKEYVRQSKSNRQFDSCFNLKIINICYLPVNVSLNLHSKRPPLFFRSIVVNISTSVIQSSLVALC